MERNLRFQILDFRFGRGLCQIVDQIKPKEYIFPMHYGIDNFDDLLPINEFLEEQEKAKIAKSTDNKVTLNRDAQRPRPLIVQLNWEPKKKK